MAPDWSEELLNTLEWKAPYGKYLAIDSIKEIGPDEARLKGDLPNITEMWKQKKAD